MSEAARRATTEDLPAIRHVAAEQRKATVDQRGGSILLRRESAEDVSIRAKALLASETDGELLVGTYDGVVFGYGAVVYENLDDSFRLARLTDFVVESEIRGSGIGEAMMNLAIELAKENGCSGIDSMALPGDRHTKNFFESFGLKARLLVVHKSFEEPSD